MSILLASSNSPTIRKAGDAGLMPDVPRLGNVISEVLLHQNLLTIDDIETLGGLDRKSVV